MNCPNCNRPTLVFQSMVGGWCHYLCTSCNTTVSLSD